MVTSDAVLDALPDSVGLTVTHIARKLTLFDWTLTMSTDGTVTAVTL
jgi:hypothetical protein